MAGMRRGPLPRFVKQYADLRTGLADAARSFADDVAKRDFPGENHTFH
jgi:3-methyl-2-oxobutanoate hydroxymethyltransferase